MYKLLLLIYLPLQAAAPVMHCLLAQEYLNAHKSHYRPQERYAFLRGTLFPDIRYIANISRARTHDKDVTLDAIHHCSDPFTAGKLFHTYVDEQRERIAQREGAYDLVNTLPHRQQGVFLKALEDECLYNKFNKEEVLTALKAIDPGEQTFGIPLYKIRAWHKHLIIYMKQSPLQLFQQRVQHKQGYFMISRDYP